jgi:hypothetical protein
MEMTKQRPRPEMPSPSDMINALQLAAATQTGAGPTLQDIAKAHPDVVERLANLDAARAAIAVGSLLTVPTLQGLCLRLEMIVHLTLMTARGRNSLYERHARDMIRALGEGFCGQMEDPAEELFVGTVRTPRGNFRLLEGIWEGNSFYLQRILNVMEEMPEGSGYDEIRNDAYALLTLSDLICARAGLERNQLGTEMPARRLSANDVGNLRSRTRHICFSLAELNKCGIQALHLAPFMFQPDDRAFLSTEYVGNSSLERRPLIHYGDDIAVVLPTAISVAIRNYIIQRMTAAEMIAPLCRGIAEEYSRHFKQLPLLGGRSGATVVFEPTKHGAIASLISTIDHGRYLNAVFFTDNLADFEKTGFAGMNPDSMLLGGMLKRHIDHAYSQVSSQPDFVDGTTLVVGCGIGRGSAFLSELGEHTNWETQFISAYDLDTLSWLPGCRPLSLWRLLIARRKVHELGINLVNMNGLLNLAAWTRSLNGHMVPHGDLPDDFVDEGQEALLVINQNSLRGLRFEVARYHDARVIQDGAGRWIPVRRDRQSDFADDHVAPLYGTEVRNDEGWPMSIFLSSTRTWWAEISIPPDTIGSTAYDRWRIMTVWHSRAVPILDGLPGIPATPVKWRAVFEAPSSGIRDQGPLLTYEEVRTSISVTVDPTAATVCTIASPLFEDAIHHVENIAERALVDAMLEGMLILAGNTQEARPMLLRAIVMSPRARQAHGFVARDFRDHLYIRLSRKIIKIDQVDDATIRLGVGWTVRDRSLGGRLSGKEETIRYLNKLVTAIEDKLCAKLQSFNREALLKRLLLNHEAAAADRNRWRRTAASVLALHADEESTLATISKHQMKLNEVFQTSRILMEMAICESPQTGGRKPGDLDLSQLMAEVEVIYHMGGWSDAIRWDVMEPLIRVTPLGDVHAKLDYVDKVIAPHLRETNDVLTKEAAENYADNLQLDEGRAPLSELMDAEFLEAWEEEFGTSIENMRTMVRWLENKGLKRNEPVFILTRADFEAVDADGATIAPDVVNRLLDKLTLHSRPAWRNVPDGYSDRDRQPWRYRRRLSVLRRPILKFASGDTDRYLIAPGLVAEAFVYQVSNFMRGDFPQDQLGPKMTTWSSRKADARGAAFAREVAAALQGSGWKTEVEVKLTKIVRRPLDRNYGDIDVLAWRPGGQRILAIECKDVQFKKSYGEICEQIADFRGELRPNGKPDYLRRHLDRMDQLGKYADDLASYCNMAGASSQLESHLIFKNPVPMKYALKWMGGRVTVSLFDEISRWA